MSFGEHLEELRKCLVWAFGWLAAGMAIGLPSANAVINYVQTPLKASLEDYYATKSRKEIETKIGAPVSNEFFQWMQLNKRYRQDVEIDIRDLQAALNEKTEVPSEAPDSKPLNPSVSALRSISIYMPIQTNTEALGLQEPFMIWLKAGFVVGFVVASPGIFYSLWTFIAAGLYPHERRYVYFFLR